MRTGRTVPHRLALSVATLVWAGAYTLLTWPSLRARVDTLTANGNPIDRLTLIAALAFAWTAPLVPVAQLISHPTQREPRRFLTATHGLIAAATVIGYQLISDATITTNTHRAAGWLAIGLLAATGLGCRGIDTLTAIAANTPTAGLNEATCPPPVRRLLRASGYAAITALALLGLRPRGLPGVTGTVVALTIATGWIVLTQPPQTPRH